MKKLIQFELQKILIKHSSIISISVILLLSFFLSFFTFQNMYSFDGKSNEGKGKTAVEIDKSIAAKYKGILTDEKVQQMMSDFKPNYDLHGMNAKYLYQNTFQSAIFFRFSDIDGNWNGLTVADVFGKEEIKIGYITGWLYTSQNLIRILITLSLVIMLLIAPVFSGEYSGIDNIILTSRYGKTTCAIAKIIASFLSATFVTFLVVTFHFIIAFLFYGKEGLDCSILFAPLGFVEGYIPFPISCKTLLNYQLLLAFTNTISITGITLLLSALYKNQMIVLMFSAATYFIPILFPISETNTWYRIVILMPVYHLQFNSIMSVEQMKNGMLYAVWAVPVAITLAVVGSLISYKVFAKHQVS